MSSITPELDLDLECSLCKDIYRDPKTLGCLHSFCLECLEIYIEGNHSNVSLTCPICRTPFQQQQISNLSTDSYLLNALYVHNSLANSSPRKKKQKFVCLDEENEATFYCLDCQEYFCEACAKVHQKAKISKHHQIIAIEKMKDEVEIKSISNSQSSCQIHQQKEVELFCNDCKLPICLLCVDQHPSHKISTLSKDLIDYQKQFLIDLINQVKPKEKELREGIDKCEEVIKELEINSATTQTKINQLFKEIRTKLDEKEQELLNKLDEIEKYKKKELELQKEELNFGIESIIGSCQMIENSLSLPTQNDVRLLSMVKPYCSRLDYLSNNKWRIEPCHISWIEFLSENSGVNSIYLKISNIGVIDSNHISPEKCETSRVQGRIFKDEEFEFEIFCHSKEGNQMKKGGNGKNFKIKIEGEANKENNEKSEYKIIDLDDGTYIVRMKLRNEGKCSIFVQYDGIDISSSPFPLQVLPKLKPRDYNEILKPKLTFGWEGDEGDETFNPFGITMDLNGNILVCDNNNNRIVIFDSEGNFISTFGSEGDGDGQFDSPMGITINSKGDIIVSDSGNHRIQIFDSEGNFISKFGEKGDADGQFHSPNGICVDMYDEIYICDFGNHRIQVFDSDGTFISTIGSQGTGNGQFKNPSAITINSKENIIIICDSGNDRIQIFDCGTESFVSKFGSSGNRSGQLDRPWGICVDLNDNILVSDFRNHRIQIFDSGGMSIKQIYGTIPRDITIDPRTQNIVASSEHKIFIY